MPRTAQLLSLLQTMHDVALGWLEAPGDHVHWDSTAQAMLGKNVGPLPAPWTEALTSFAEPGRGALSEAVAHAFGHASPFDLTVALSRTPPMAEGPCHVRVRGRWLPADGDAAGAVALILSLGNRAEPAASAPELEHAISAAGIGLWEVDLASGTERWSPQTLAMYGLPPDAAAPSRDTWRHHYLHPDDRARQAEQVMPLEADGLPYDFDYRIRRADGEVRWLHSRAAVQPGPGRRVVGLTMDITARKDAERRAAEGWQLLELTSAHIGFGFGYRERQSGRAHWSVQLKRMHGLPAESPTPTPEQFMRWVAPESRDVVAANLFPSVPPGEVIEYRFDIVRVSDGQRRTLFTRSVWLPDEAGAPWRICFATVDLSEQVARERQMNETQQRLQLATQALGIGTWERDLGAERGRWDATTLALFGLPPGGPAPNADEYLQLVHPADRDWVNERFHPQRITRREHLDFSFRLARPEGEARWLHILGSGECDASGQVVRRVGICMDVTARRSAEEALRAKELAERANQAKTQFLSRMSHELRTPLNAVLGFAQVMALDTQTPLPAAQQSRVKHIQDAGWHLLHLIDDVLDIASIESREAPLRMDWVPLAEVLQEVLALHAADAVRAGVTLHIEASALTLWCDRRRLKQLLLNLVSNAIKYNRAGGRVDVGAARVGADDTLWVRDTGLGIEPARLAELFQPFNRLGRERTGIPGHGIGLALCRQIAEWMHGRLEVRSEPGVGSEFRLVLPHPGSSEAPAGKPNR